MSSKKLLKFMFLAIFTCLLLHGSATTQSINSTSSITPRTFDTLPDSSPLTTHPTTTTTTTSPPTTPTSPPKKDPTSADQAPTITSINIIYVSYLTLEPTITIPISTTISTFTTTTTANNTTTTSLSFTITNTVIITSTLAPKTQPLSTASGLCYWAAEDVLTPCTSAVIGAATSPGQATSGASRNGIYFFSTIYRTYKAICKHPPLLPLSIPTHQPVGKQHQTNDANPQYYS